MSPVVVLPVCRPDFHQAIKWIKWARWMFEHKNSIGYELVVFAAKSLDDSHVRALAAVIRGIEPWSIEINPEYYEPHELGYAACANHMFKRALEMTEKKFPGRPTLWCEPDCIPIHPQWHFEIEEEYAWCSRPFLGDFHAPSPIPHLTGNSVYPPNWRELAPILATLPAVEQGWDSQAAHQVVPQSHKSCRIQQEWMVPAPKFTERNINMIHPSTALFHRDKTGTLIDVLAARLGCPPIPLEEPICQPSPMQSARYAAPIVGRASKRGMHMLIVSCRRDAEFAEFLFRSIVKNTADFGGCTLVIPVQDVKCFNHVPDQIKVTTFDEKPGKGFLQHMINICRADELCPNADKIVHIDSDCLFWRKTTPEDFAPDGKCLLVREDYRIVEHRNSNRLLWRTCVERATGLTPNCDYMVRHPQVYPRGVYAALRTAVERHTGMNFDSFVMSCENGWPQTFAEFPALGTIAMQQFFDAYTVVDYDHEADAREIGTHRRDFQYAYRPERDALVEGHSHSGMQKYRRDWENFLRGELPKYYLK